VQYYIKYCDTIYNIFCERANGVMLTHLHVKNLAIVEEIEVDFSDKLNILTGETGVGKSIIIGSINIALGAKISSDMIRTDAEYALVEMIFDIDDEEEEFLNENDISSEDGMIVISRKISNGRSVSKINGETVTLSMLKKIAGRLIDIHGQHEHQSLLYPDNHLLIIDRYGKDDIYPLKEETASLYRAYTDIKKKFDSMQFSEEQRNRELSFLEFEKNEIEEADIKDGEEEELEALYKKLSNCEKVLNAVGQAYDYTSAGNSNAASMISSALSVLNDVAEYDESAGNYVNMLIDIENILSDVNHEMSAYIDDYSFDEELFAQTEERLDFVRKIMAKYGGSKESLDAHYDEVIEKYNQLVDYEEHKKQIEAEFAVVESNLSDVSQRLSVARKKAADEIRGLIENALKELNFLDVKFEIAINAEENFSQNGYDKAEFMISTNPGEPVKPLGKIASGGELSRIMLAIKSVLAKKDSIHTLVFDEIDTGISGRTAQKVSEKLAVIADCHQVICITHLAQIASMADEHYVIEKNSSDGRTRTDIRKLDNEGAIEEIARILGGARITEAVLGSANEMKNLAMQWKNSIN